MKKFYCVLGLMAMICMFSAGLLQATILYVGGAGLPNYATIQLAINASTSGDTIVIAPGTYNETVYINKPLTLLGANAGIHPAVGMHSTEVVGTRVSETIINSGQWNIQARDITIDGFKFMQGARDIQLQNNAVTTDLANLHVTNNIFTSDGTPSKGMINIETSNLLDYSHMLVDFNLFEKYYDGIRVGAGHSDGMTIVFNDFGKLSFSHAIYAYPAEKMINAVLENNKFDGPAIEMTNVQGMKIRHNSWYGDGSNVILRLGGSGYEITDNSFLATLYAAYYPTYGNLYPPAVITLTYTSWAISDVVIARNTIRYNENAGFAGAISYGVWLRKSTGTDVSTIRINQNIFEDRGQEIGSYAVFQDATIPENAADATCNWWGASSGPAPVGSVGKGKVSENVIYVNPWLRIADIDHDSLSFGSKQVNVEYADQFLTITNPDQSPCDNSDLTIESIVLPMPDYKIVYSSKSLVYPMTLAAGENLVLKIRFLPLSVGAKNGDLIISCKKFGDITESSLVYLTGSGWEPTKFQIFTIEEAKIDWKKKADDDKIMVKGSFTSSSVIDIGDQVTFTIGKFTQSITMDAKGKKDQKWEFKREKGVKGDIKDMKIEFKKNEIKFEIHVDKEELDPVSLWTNPVTISLQIGDDKGTADVLMKADKKNDTWEYKNK